MLKVIFDYLPGFTSFFTFALNGLVSDVKEREMFLVDKSISPVDEIIMIPRLERCLGIGFVGSLRGGVANGFAGMHIEPFEELSDMEKIYKSVIRKQARWFADLYGLSMVVFAGGQVDVKENRNLYQVHREGVMVPMSFDFQDTTCIQFLPTEKTQLTHLILTDSYVKVVQEYGVATTQMIKDLLYDVV